MTKQRGAISGPLFAALIVIPFAFCSLMQPKPEEPHAPDRVEQPGGTSR